MTYKQARSLVMMRLETVWEQGYLEEYTPTEKEIAEAAREMMQFDYDTVLAGNRMHEANPELFRRHILDELN